MQIVDVSPTRFNTDAGDINRSVIGRMLSIACSPDGQVLYAGSYSNLWVSQDGGQTWEQLTWPQPDPDQFDVPGSLGGWCVVDIAVALGWRVDKHPRFLAKLTGSGFADIVGFGDCGVWTALGNGDGSFQNPNVVISNFGYEAGGWQVDKHPRVLADLTGNGRADIVGFGDAGVWTALSNGDGTFQAPQFVLADFGYEAGGWQVDKHPRVLADLTGNGRADIVGFGDAGVWTALSNGDGTFTEQFVLANFGYEAGGWQVDKHPRFLADLTGNGRADIVGFGDAGVWTALSNGDGTFQAPQFVLANFGYEAGGWQVDKHPRFLADLTGNGRADIVGFGDAGVWTALSNGDGTFQAPQFVLANFGYETIVLALIVNDLAKGSRGLWRSTDGGTSWTQVHQFSSALNLGQLQWALGSDHLVYAAGGKSLAISKNAGATFEDVLPSGNGPAASVNHVAVWQNSPADPFPAVIYALGDSTMFLSFDGGVTWMQDNGTLPPNVGGLVSPVANFNTPNVMAISPRCPLEVYVAQNGSAGTPALYRGDYTRFPGTQTSSWEALVLPDLLTNWNGQDSGQDSGNVFLATTQKGRGDLLFYGAQTCFQNCSQSAAYVGPLYPAAASDWHLLGGVHPDLHGFLLSPDFSAAIKDGNYQPGSGTAWILSDGGIYRSTNGGENFDPAKTATTLSCLSVAGVAIADNVALSLNEGDNDGFYSMNGGQNWSYQQYAGGDNDCAFADPLRPHAMMVFTPRWDTAGNLVYTWQGQTVAVYQTNPGNLPDASATGHDRKAVTGPPAVYTNPYQHVWNASSFYGERGSRPIVLGLAGESAPAQGDYFFVLNPGAANPVLVRTQNIFDIKHRDEWVTTATGPGQGANVFLQGPPLPEADLGVVQASGGHANTVFFAGGADPKGGNTNLWTWTAGAADWTKIVPAPAIPGQSVGAQTAIRFFLNPYQPNLIYILDSDDVKRSDDGGQTWNVDQGLETQLTWNQQIAITSGDDPSGIGEHFDLVLTDMQFDPNYPQVRVAIGAGGVFLTIDGVNWTRLLHTGALPGRPSSCYLDSLSESTATLYVAFAGRSLVGITGLLLTTIF